MPKPPSIAEKSCVVCNVEDGGDRGCDVDERDDGGGGVGEERVAGSVSERRERA